MVVESVGSSQKCQFQSFYREEIIMNDKCVVLNAKKMNFDGKLDFSILSSDVTVYVDTTEQ